MFSSRSFIVSGLTFRSLIHFEFIIVYGVKKCSSFSLSQVVDKFSQLLLLSCFIESDSVRPHRWQPTRLPHPWDSLGKNTGVGCHFLLQCMKVKSQSEVAQSRLTLSDLMDYSLPGPPSMGFSRQEYWSVLSKYCRVQVFPASLVKELVFSPLYILASFVKDKVMTLHLFLFKSFLIFLFFKKKIKIKLLRLTPAHHCQHIHTHTQTYMFVFHYFFQ